MNAVGLNICGKLFDVWVNGCCLHFQRVSRSFWFLLNKFFVILCGVFCDDFTMFSLQPHLMLLRVMLASERSSLTLRPEKLSLPRSCPTVLVGRLEEAGWGASHCQIELDVMVLLRWQFQSWFCNRRTIWWVDNDAARWCLIKDLTSSLTMKNALSENTKLRMLVPHVQLDGTGSQHVKHCSRAI